MAVNVLVLLALLELGSVGAYFIRTREFFYTRNRNRLRTTREAFQSDFLESPDSVLLPDLQLHPYFGFVDRDRHIPGATRPNNIGLRSPYDLPYRKTNSNQFVIGVVGGSVAAIYADYEVKHHILEAAIRRLPGFQNRELIILNLAAGAFKEPQQLMVLNYALSLGQEFDAIINIDGFNEVAIAAMNGRAGLETTMPAGVMVVPLINLADKGSSQRIDLIAKTGQARATLIASLDRLDRCRLAVCYTANWMLSNYWQRKYNAFLLELAEQKVDSPNDKSLVWLARSEKSNDSNQSAEEGAQVWANSSMVLKDFLGSRRIPYFQFVQPNQYHATRRQFSEAERKIAFNDQSQFRAGAIAGYPKLVARIADLQKSGVRIFNAVEAFDDVKEPVYGDDCCHYNELGRKVFSDFVAQRIVSELEAPGTK